MAAFFFPEILNNWCDFFKLLYIRLGKNFFMFIY